MVPIVNNCVHISTAHVSVFVHLISIENNELSNECSIAEGKNEKHVVLPAILVSVIDECIPIDSIVRV